MAPRDSDGLIATIEAFLAQGEPKHEKAPTADKLHAAYHELFNERDEPALTTYEQARAFVVRYTVVSRSLTIIQPPFVQTTLRLKHPLLPEFTETGFACCCPPDVYSELEGKKLSLRRATTRFAYRLLNLLPALAAFYEAGERRDVFGLVQCMNRIEGIMTVRDPRPEEVRRGRAR